MFLHVDMTRGESPVHFPDWACRAVTIHPEPEIQDLQPGGMLRCRPLQQRRKRSRWGTGISFFSRLTSCSMVAFYFVKS